MAYDESTSRNPVRFIQYLYPFSNRHIIFLFNPYLLIGRYIILRVKLNTRTTFLKSRGVEYDMWVATE
jgi:hypothetical protein